MMTSTLLIALAAGIGASFIGGAIGGMLVGGKDLGYDLAGMMGAFYGPVAGVAGVILGLSIVFFI